MLNLESYPTIQQAQAHADVSDRYGFVSTKQVLEVLADYHFHPVSVQEMTVRKYSRKGFQKHLIRLEQTNARTSTQVGDVIPQLAFINSHDRSSQVELLIALLRKACMNGLFVSENANFHSQKIRHLGYTAEKVATALIQIVNETPKAIDAMRGFQAIDLTDREQVAFAESAIELANDGEKFAMRPYDLLAARRYDDRKSDLWTTFNRVQENLIRGGVARTTKDGKSRRTREVKSIDRNVDLNRALWSLTEKMAELKTA